MRLLFTLWRRLFDDAPKCTLTHCIAATCTLRCSCTAIAWQCERTFRVQLIPAAVVRTDVSTYIAWFCFSQIKLPALRTESLGVFFLRRKSLQCKTQRFTQARTGKEWMHEVISPSHLVKMGLHHHALNADVLGWQINWKTVQRQEGILYYWCASMPLIRFLFQTSLI